MKKIISLEYMENLKLKENEVIALTKALDSFSKKKQIFWPASFIEEEVNFFKCTWIEGPNYDHEGRFVSANKEKGYKRELLSESEYTKLMEWVEKEKDEHIFFFPSRYNSFPQKEVSVRRIVLVGASTKKEWEKLIKNHYDWRFRQSDLDKFPWKK